MALRAGICGAVRRSVRPSLTRASATTRTGSGLPAWRSLGIAASDVLRPEPHLTHEVVNQSVPFTDYNAFDSDRGLVEAVARGGGDWAKKELQAFGERVGCAETMEWQATAHTHTPVFKPYNQFGEHINRIDYHPAYHSLISQAIEHHVPSFAWVHRGEAGSHVVRAALGYMQYQADYGVSCPITMTFACVPALENTPSIADNWVPKLTSGIYDSRDIPVGEKQGATMGMSMTEKQGGSDVRANTTRATALGSHGPGEQYSITGHKWFTSAPMCDAFLTLAHTDEGVSCFLIPRWLPDGSRNVGFRVTRLKDKMGDKSNASSEVEYDNAWGVMIGEPGRGVPTILEMVVHTRLDCALGSASLMHQAVQNAVHHAGQRAAFGAALIDQPAMVGVLADLCVESEAATITSMRLARAFDDTIREGEDSEASAFRRMATAVAKYWICKRAPNVVYEALECHGGNGYTEEWPMARMFRQSPLNSIWEGSGNVICLDVLRAAGREPESLRAFSDFLASGMGLDHRLDRLLHGLRRTMTDGTLNDPVHAQAAARGLVDRMAVAMQAILLITEGDADAAELYCAARIGRDGTWNYGALPLSDDPAADLARAARVVDRFNVE